MHMTHTVSYPANVSDSGPPIFDLDIIRGLTLRDIIFYIDRSELIAPILNSVTLNQVVVFPPGLVYQSNIELRLYLFVVAGPLGL